MDSRCIVDTDTFLGTFLPINDLSFSKRCEQFHKAQIYVASPLSQAKKFIILDIVYDFAIFIKWIPLLYFYIPIIVFRYLRLATPILKAFLFRAPNYSRPCLRD